MAVAAEIGITGDLMCHFGFVIHECEGQRFREFFAPEVRELCSEHDELWGNLEGPVGRSDNGIDLQLYMLKKQATWPKLFFPRPYLGPLLELGFRVFGVANNHSLDFETPDDAAISSAAVTAAGGVAVGTSFVPAVRIVDGLSFAIFSATCLLNPPLSGGEVAMVTRNNAARLYGAIARWKGQVDYVVVMMHWGWDYVPEPPPGVLRFAERLFEAGANVIYGNHPHILWPIEQRSPTQIVCYSMGNFTQVFGCTSDHRHAETYRKSLLGGLLTLSFTKERIKPVFHPLLTRHNFDEWHADIQIGKSYWFWSEREIRNWLENLSNRRKRFRTRIERTGVAMKLPLSMHDIEALHSHRSRSDND